MAAFEPRTDLPIEDMGVDNSPHSLDHLGQLVNDSGQLVEVAGGLGYRCQVVDVGEVLVVVEDAEHLDASELGARGCDVEVALVVCAGECVEKHVVDGDRERAIDELPVPQDRVGEGQNWRDS